MFGLNAFTFGPNPPSVPTFGIGSGSNKLGATNSGWALPVSQSGFPGKGPGPESGSAPFPF